MRRQWRLYLLALPVVGLALFVSTPSSHVKADDDDEGSIVGTWILTATLPGNPPFDFPELLATHRTPSSKSVALINAGGTLTITDSVFNVHTSQNPFLPPPLLTDDSDGYGAWKRLGDSNRFVGACKRLLFAWANTPKDLYGPFFVGQQVREATIQFVGTLQHGEDGDTLAVPATFEARNLREEVVFAGSATFSAKRLEVEPLATP